MKYYRLRDKIIKYRPRNTLVSMQKDAKHREIRVMTKDFMRFCTIYEDFSNNSNVFLVNLEICENLFFEQMSKYLAQSISSSFPFACTSSLSNHRHLIYKDMFDTRAQSNTV